MTCYLSCDCCNCYLVAIDLSYSVLQLLDKIETSPLMSLLLLWRHWLCYCSGPLASFCIHVHSAHTSCSSYTEYWTYWSISCLSPSDLESCESAMSDLNVHDWLCPLYKETLGLFFIYLILLYLDLCRGKLGC